MDYEMVDLFSYICLGVGGAFMAMFVLMGMKYRTLKAVKENMQYFNSGEESCDEGDITMTMPKGDDAGHIMSAAERKQAEINRKLREIDAVKKGGSYYIEEAMRSAKGANIEAFDKDGHGNEIPVEAEVDASAPPIKIGGESGAMEEGSPHTGIMDSGDREEKGMPCTGILLGDGDGETNGHHTGILDSVDAEGSPFTGILEPGAKNLSQEKLYKEKREPEKEGPAKYEAGQDSQKNAIDALFEGMMAEEEDGEDEI
jgi:hypothetical protein